MILNLDTTIQLLPFAFAIHNFEEVLGMEKWTNSIPPAIHTPVTTRQFSLAVSIFTVVGFAVVFSPAIIRSDYYYFLIAGFAGMILLNVFIPHLLATVFLRKYAPGVITGLVFNLPITLTILFLLNSQQKLTQNQIVVSVIVGGFVGITLAYVFLKVGSIVDNAMSSKKQLIN